MVDDRELRDQDFRRMSASTQSEPMPETNPLAFGHLIEGRLEQDPMTDEYVIRTVDSKGKPMTVNLHKILASLKGEDVRFTLVSFENLARLAAMVEEAGGGQVASAVTMDEIPGANVIREPD